MAGTPGAYVPPSPLRPLGVYCSQTFFEISELQFFSYLTDWKIIGSCAEFDPSGNPLVDGHVGLA